MDLIDFLNNYFKNNNIKQHEIEIRTGISQSKLSLTLNRKRKLTADELVVLVLEFNLDFNIIKEIIQSPNLQ